LEIFKGFFRLKITRKLLVLIKNGEKVTHIFSSQFNTQQHHKKIKKLFKTHEKINWKFLTKFFEYARVQKVETARTIAIKQGNTQ
jgi:hypothetical protein